jgi:DNA-binding response OmpR family regulator
MARILLVEDHDIVHRMLCDAIIFEGHEADCVKTCREAEEALAHHQYALVICDVLLPDGSGRDVAAKAADRGAKALLITGHPQEAQALLVSGITHLMKPFSLKSFVALIQKHVV